MLQAVTEAVFAVVETRLQQQHRLLVATCFGLAKLNMACEEDDYVKAFLIPLNLDQTWLWEEVIPMKKEKVINVEEEDKEQDMEEEKNKEEKEESEEDNLETMAVEKHKDQADETFPSWIPNECNIKV